MRSFRTFAICFLIMFTFGAQGIAQKAEEHVHASPGSEEGLGRAFVRGRDGCVGFGAKGTCGEESVFA